LRAIRAFDKPAHGKPPALQVPRCHDPRFSHSLTALSPWLATIREGQKRGASRLLCTELAATADGSIPTLRQYTRERRAGKPWWKLQLKGAVPDGVSSEQALIGAMPEAR
jgi:hypothetical protein